MPPDEQGRVPVRLTRDAERNVFVILLRQRVDVCGLFAADKRLELRYQSAVEKVSVSVPHGWFIVEVCLSQF